MITTLRANKRIAKSTAGTQTCERRKLPVTEADLVVGFAPHVTSLSDYYPFGSGMEGRTFTEGYRYGFNAMEREDELYAPGSAYDFGARMYDGRLGRWWSVDPQMNRAPELSVYRAFFNNPIKFVDPNGEFEVDPAFKLKYPTVALVLENADKLYNNEALPTELEEALRGVDYRSIFSNVMRVAFQENSTLSYEEIQEVITPGKGPLVSSRDLDDVGFDGEDRLVNGKNVEIMRNNGTPTGINERREDGKKGHIVIDDDVAGMLEFVLSGESDLGLSGLGGKSPSNENRQSALLAFVATLFHEAVHYGRNETGAGNGGMNLNNDDPARIEYGKKFENEAFGKDVSRVAPGDLRDN